MKSESFVYLWVAVPRPVVTTSAFDVVYPQESSRTSASGANQTRSTTASAGSRWTDDARTQVSTSTSLSSAPTPAEAFCEARVFRNVHWPRTPAGKTVVMKCPNNNNSQSLFVFCRLHQIGNCLNSDFLVCFKVVMLMFFD